MRDYGHVYSRNLSMPHLSPMFACQVGVLLHWEERLHWLQGTKWHHGQDQIPPSSYLMSCVLGLFQVFTKLDLCNAHHLVRICDGDEWKTMLNTRTGYFEYFVLPFGLTNTSAVFQALFNDVLRERSVFVYLDDRHSSLSWRDQGWSCQGKGCSWVASPHPPKRLCRGFWGLEFFIDASSETSVRWLHP